VKAGITALIFSFFIALICGPLIIPILRRLKAGQQVRGDGPRTHLKKTGTPTMGGIIFLVPLVMVMLLLNRPGPQTYTVLLVTLGFGLIGFTDDFIKIVLRRPLGLKARYKLMGQGVLSLILVGVVVLLLGRGTSVPFPFSNWHLELGWFYYPFALLVVVYTSNAVNLTDGLDGLAGGVTFIVALAYLCICARAGQNELAIFAGAIAGGCLGFLVFNLHPARVFMGDTGSLALGVAIACLAILTKTELLLPLIGGIYLLETLSVILQVIFFRFTRKRLFRMSPLHHHFELSGWPETRVVFTFWVTAMVFAALGLLGLVNFS
jgi:phospho-N-acetylmuramoyl-pentapeptide-transferase